MLNISPFSMYIIMMFKIKKKLFHTIFMNVDYFLQSFALASVIWNVLCVYKIVSMINYLDFYVSVRYLLSIRLDNRRFIITHFQMLLLTQIKK